jgi:tetratricopeptide (TPR) repeat protein
VLVITSTNPADGPVAPASPDVAVVQLDDDGPDLPAELPLATAEELLELFGQPVGFLGFPGHDYRDWPSIGSEAAATYHDGVVSRLTDFQLNGGAADEDKQCLQYTMASWGGYSGSPVFLPNGHVVAIHNMARYHKGPLGEVKAISHGVRIDCLWELIVHHQLVDQVPIGVEPSQVRVARWLKEDEQADKYRQAISLVADAAYLINGQSKYSEGVDKCNEAVKLAPHFPELYAVRFTGYLNYVFDNHRRIPRDTSLRQLRLARNDAEKYIQLAPSDPQGIFYLATAMNNAAFLTKNRDEFRRVLAMGDRLLGSQNLTSELRAKAHSIRGNGYSNLGQNDLALAEFNEALRLNPNDAALWETRADYWRNLGRGSLADSDKKKAHELRAKMQRPGTLAGPSAE